MNQKPVETMVTTASFDLKNVAVFVLWSVKPMMVLRKMLLPIYPMIESPTQIAPPILLQLFKSLFGVHAFIARTLKKHNTPTVVGLHLRNQRHRVGHSSSRCSRIRVYMQLKFSVNQKNLPVSQVDLHLARAAFLAISSCLLADNDEPAPIRPSFHNPLLHGFKLTITAWVAYAT